MTSQLRWRDRATAELAELEGKIERLTAFIDLGCLGVDAVEKELLYKQRYAMNEYLAVLRQRVRRFEG